LRGSGLPPRGPLMVNCFATFEKFLANGTAARAVGGCAPQV